jgi:DnaJ-class molecular chaperone
VLRLRGRGEAGLNGGAPGDALIEIRVRPHPFFVRVGDDLHVEMPVSLIQAILGARIIVPTRTGTVTVTVPESSDTGRTLRLRGKGVPAHRGKRSGDQYVKLKIVLGSAAHAPELKEFLRRLSMSSAPA